MRALTDQERRTVRLATIGIAIYLGLFFGWRLYGYCRLRQAEYHQLLQHAAVTREKLRLYDDKAAALARLMDEFRMDPGKLSRTTLVAQATAAIQTAAQSGGLQLGPVRESPSRTAGRELASVQLEGAGPVPAVLQFLQSLPALGYPVVADSIQLNQDNTRPGQLKINITILILDYEAWKPEEGQRRA